MKRSKLCEDFLKLNEVNCCSITKENDEGSFSNDGCECCQAEWDVKVYKCSGYNPKTQDVVELGDVCHDCICYFYYGDDQEMEA